MRLGTSGPRSAMADEADSKSLTIEEKNDTDSSSGHFIDSDIVEVSCSFVQLSS